jgi:hypothetical protein
VALSFLEHPAANVSRHKPHIAKNLIRLLMSIGVPSNTHGDREP